MIGILGAMKEEVDALIEALDQRCTVPGKVTEFHSGTIDGKQVVVAKTGVGKVLAALSAAELINRFNPEYLLFTGIAGGIDERIAIGDLVVAEDCMQYDFDVTALGFPLGTIPYSSYREIPADPLLLSAVRSFRPEDYSMHFGRILTGDTFVTDKHTEPRSGIFRDLQGMAVEMEGASVALTSQVYGVPVLVLRFISDAADGSAPKNFSSFLETASRHSLHVLRHILQQI